MPPRIPVPVGDAAKRVRILHLLADVLGTQSRLAEVIGVGESTLSQWFRGLREPDEWHVILAAVGRTIRRCPEHEQRIVEVVALELFDARGTWVPDVEPGDARSLAEESSDVTEAHGRVITAIRSDNPDVLRVATRDLVREAVGLASAAA